MFKFHPFPDSARCFLAISMTLVQYLLVRFWPGRKLFPVTISHTERVPSNVAFLNLPFLSHHGCQEGFWEASAHSKAGTCSSESPPKPSSMHETASPTYGPRAFISLSPYVEYQLGAVSLIRTFLQIYWCGAPLQHPVGQLSFTLKYITQGGLMMSQSTFPFHKALMYPTWNPFKICN